MLLDSTDLLAREKSPAQTWTGDSTTCATGSPTVYMQEGEPLSANQQRSSWVAEARAFPTIELWFHSLVRRHFGGTVKVRAGWTYTVGVATPDVGLAVHMGTRVYFVGDIM